MAAPGAETIQPIAKTLGGSGEFRELAQSNRKAPRGALRGHATKEEDKVSLNPYLYFNGNCEEAMRHYAEVLGGEIETMMTYAEAPAEEAQAPAMREKIMHAYLKFEDQALMASDAPPEHFERPQGFAVQLAVGEPGEAERIFNALAEGGEVRMPMEETFWAIRFGMLVDRFGVPWMINCNR
jgi:PhnB protein